MSSTLFTAQLTCGLFAPTSRTFEYVILMQCEGESWEMNEIRNRKSPAAPIEPVGTKSAAETNHGAPAPPRLSNNAMLSPRDLLLALVVLGIWGSNFVVIHWGLEHVPPLT